ncbi:MAG: RdgB/HAM1 family non-canonical purine NTP pyrophosphatase [Candidatus Omnitrophota bacterium]
MELLIATRNRKKFKEIKDLLKKNVLRTFSLADFPGLPKIKETGATFKANAEKKAREISRLTRKLTLGEDSGLCVDALKGAPGVFSSRFAGKQKSDEDNNNKLLRLLKSLPLAKRKAHYVCAVAIAYKGKILKTVEGRCSGLIGFKRQGTSGFGYDPLFIIPRYKKTFGQLGLKIKHKMSHRSKAIKKLKKYLSCLKFK